MWIGRWHVEDRTALADVLSNEIGEDLHSCIKEMYQPILAHVYHAHALRVYLLNGKIPSQIQSVYTTKWYADMPSLPSHPLQRHPHLIDRDWELSSLDSTQDDVEYTQNAPSNQYRGRKRRMEMTTDEIPNQRHDIQTTPTEARVPVSQRFYYTNKTEPEDEPFQRPRRHRISRLSQEQIRQAVKDKNTALLNEVAAQRKLPGYESMHIAIDLSGRGLCLRATSFIPQTAPTDKKGFCEYTGTERPVSAKEHINSVPLRQLMYGCEYERDGVRYRKSPDQDLQSLLRYMQAPNPGEEPTCRLLAVKDTKTTTTVSLFINRPIQPEEALTIDYGGPYWQIFWPHLLP